jgi:hypothetical protein
VAERHLSRQADEKRVLHRILPLSWFAMPPGIRATPPALPSRGKGRTAEAVPKKII